MATDTENSLAHLCDQQRERIEQLTADAVERDVEIATMAAENDMLWAVLAQITCDCVNQNEPEVFPLPLDHEDGCKYRDWHASIKEPAPVVEVTNA